MSRAGEAVICRPCRDAADRHQPHDECPGGTWCDCQHGDTSKEQEKPQ
jgi:hypothetical protein